MPEVSSFAEARRLQPGALDAFGELLATVWLDSALEPGLLELARLRLATLSRCEADAARRVRLPGFDGIDEERVARLPSWPVDPTLSERERAALRYAEEFAVDPEAVSGTCWAQVNEHFTDTEAVRLSMCLATLVEFQRWCVATGVPADEELPLARDVRLVPAGASD